MVEVVGADAWPMLFWEHGAGWVGTARAEDAREAARMYRSLGRTLGGGSSAGLGHAAVGRLRRHRCLPNVSREKSVWVREQARVWRTVG